MPQFTGAPNPSSGPVKPAFVLASIGALAVGASLMVVMLLTAGPPAGFVMEIPHTPPPETFDLVGVSPEPDSGDGGTVEITEYGVSLTDDGYGDDFASVGVVVFNSSNQRAAIVELGIRPLNSDGDSIGSYETVIVPPIPPGSELGIGAAVDLHDDDVTDVDVQSAGVQWWDPETTGFGAGFAISDVEPVSRGDASIRLNFNVDSECTAALIRPDAGVVYRADDGTVIGGAAAPMMDVRTIVPPGPSRQQVWAGDMPSDANELLTDIYIHHPLPPGFE